MKFFHKGQASGKWLPKKKNERLKSLRKKHEKA